ncbi:hypothetical protein V6N12_028238 [Hibiscus sabdariffa]|uniref:Uncharacterized protein n=1 Tax=Hibiscus sabdariffa TaxID=183260 RepID=A0ABR2F586_9ROSI
MKFSQQYKTTIGADFVTKELQIDERNVTLQIWDTAGQERFQSLGVAFYRGADCCVLVYDVNVTKSFDNLDNWHEEFLKQVSLFPLPLFFRCIPFRSVRRKQKTGVLRKKTYLASKENIPYFETSAKEDINVDEAFHCIAKTALANEREQDIFGFSPDCSHSSLSEQCSFPKSNVCLPGSALPIFLLTTSEQNLGFIALAYR